MTTTSLRHGVGLSFLYNHSCWHGKPCTAGWIRTMSDWIHQGRGGHIPVDSGLCQRSTRVSED
eukprot:1736765-Amphidinium_carterae.1